MMFIAGVYPNKAQNFLLEEKKSSGFEERLFLDFVPARRRNKGGRSDGVA